MGVIGDIIFGIRLLFSEGVPVPERQAINFIGATVADDAVNKRTNVTVTAAVPRWIGASHAVWDSSGGTIAVAYDTMYRYTAQDPVEFQLPSAAQAGREIYFLEAAEGEENVALVPYGAEQIQGVAATYNYSGARGWRILTALGVHTGWSVRGAPTS